MLSTLRDLIRFMRVYRKYWLAPILFGIIALGALLVVTESTAVSSFIYALF